MYGLIIIADIIAMQPELQQLAPSDKFEQEEAGTSENAKTSKFGVALRPTKLVAAKAPQESSEPNVCVLNYDNKFV